MGLSNEELKKLEIFKNLKLDRTQTETILGHALTDREWKLVVPKDYKKIFTPIAIQASKVALKKLKAKPIHKPESPNYARIFRDIADASVKHEYGIKPDMKQIFNKVADRDIKSKYKFKATEPKFSFKDIAFQAAKVASRKEKKNLEVPKEKYHFLKSLFNNKEDAYEIHKISDYYSEKYKTRLSEWKISGTVDMFNMHETMKVLVQRMTEHIPDNCKIQVSLKTVNDDRQPHTKLLSKNEVNNILAEWVNYFIDYKDLQIGDIIFKLTAIELPTGAGRKVNAIVNLDNKRSITQINNKDKLCLVRAIIVGLTYNISELQKIFTGKLTVEEVNKINFRRQTKTQINKGIFSDIEIKYLRQGGERTLQTILAEAFHRIHSIPIKETGNDFADVKFIEDKVDIEIQIYNMDTRQIYAGTEKPTKIYLILSNNHYDVINKLPGFIGSNARSWEANEKLKCEACKNPTQCEKEKNKIKCQTCFKTFYSQNCLESHITNKKCIEHSYVCQTCFRLFKTEVRNIKDHVCSEQYCTNCKTWNLGEHDCYMQKKELREPSEKYIFYDFETKCDHKKKHIVNKCIAQYFHGQEFVFNNADEFCTWVFTKRHKGYTVIAHYGKGYDFQFVQEWLVAHTQTARPEVILNGQKILQLHVKRDYNIRFIDSISFTLQPLREFPETFGLEELAKGYFPHKFNTDENQNYIGKYPDEKYYGPEVMAKKEREKFFEWYKTTKDQTFNFKEEMYKYCKSDVDILRRGCLKLRELFMKISNIDPFQYVTIASVCNAIYRSEFLPQNTIGIVNETPSDNYSIKSIKWLKYISSRENVNIRHACNGGEQNFKINGKSYKVDGYCKETNTIYQFHGCYFHGCKDCYNDLTVNKTSKLYMYQLYKNTERINQAIAAAGYNIKTIWEHEFDNNKEMKNTKLHEKDLVEPPKIRDSFFGGRCEPIKLLYDFKAKNQKGRYIDVVSLYPTVMYHDKYPIGHPTKIVKPDAYDPNWFGFVYCKILPPRGLYHPVLPYKQKTKQAHKLLFGLCKMCMQNIDLKCTHHKNVKCKQDCKERECKECKANRSILKRTCNQCFNMRNVECFHADDQRAITGFWCTNEIQKAIEKGYQIQDIYEAWHFDNSSTDLWKGYIRKFLKIKLESSKFTCSEEEYRSKARLLGIELDKLEANPGLRFIAKICLNSLWGKFGQNPKNRQSKYIEKESDFYKIVLDDKIESLSLAFLNDSTVYASYETKDEFLKQNYNTNIYIACFTSAWARLRLYNMIDRIGRNVCYMDTDSVVYTEDESNKNIFEQEIGDSLGEWSYELIDKKTHELYYMDFWACAQSKDYGYITNKEKYVGKVKGFRVTAETEEKMNHQARIDLIKGSIKNVDINYDQFTIKNSQIFTQNLVKQWGFQFDKRRIVRLADNEIDTLPFGY